MKKYLLLLILGCGLSLCLSSINRLYTDEGESIPCDMRTLKNYSYCESCSKFLTGYLCRDCKKKVLKEKKETTEGKPDYLFYEEEVFFGQCPECKGKLKPFTLVDKRGKCIECGKKPTKKNACVKMVYACPEHPDKEFLKPGRCLEKITNKKGRIKKCSRRLVIKHINRAEITLKFVCSKCGYSTPTAPGADAKCPGCGNVCTLVGKFTCEASGEFPHVNTKEWEKRQRD